MTEDCFVSKEDFERLMSQGERGDLERLFNFKVEESGWLKLVAIISWVYGGLFALAFVAGFLGFY